MFYGFRSSRPKVKSSVNYEVKGQLAKLLATEDIIIENRKVPTASFDVVRRILTLPLWEKASEVVYDLLVGHEVGHALYTPDENWKLKYPKIPMSFVNILEDVRIEKLMKRKYPGLIKTFRKGYSQLSDMDFFEIEEVDLDTLSLPDRINLYYKVGSFVKIPFTVGESIFLRRASETNNFQEVIDLAKELTEFYTDEEENKIKTPVPVQDSAQDRPDTELERPDIGPDTTEYEETDQEEEGQSKTESKNESDDVSEFPSPVPSMGDTGGDLETVTDSTLQDNINKLTDVSDSNEEPVYVECPKLNLDTLITSGEEIYECLDDWYALTKKNLLEHNIDPFVTVDSDYVKFKKTAQKEVNYLVKEFECRKSASAYARAATSRTGVLDTSKLQTYKFNEDLFKKVTTLPDGKNHGLIFILDWSGSMSEVLLDTVKQLYNLVWFCRKVQIPYEVYAFTNEWKTRDKSEEIKTLPEHMERKERVLQVDSEFTLLNVLSSRTKTTQLDNRMKSFFRLVTSLDRKGRSNHMDYCYQYPDRLCLSGTPLNEALISLNSIIPEFRKRTKVEKVQCITLTDGDAHALKYNAICKTRYYEDDGETYMGYRSTINGKTFIRDRKTGKTYFCKTEYYEMTSALLNQLRDRFPNTNFIGIRVMANRDASNFIRRHSDFDYNKVESIVKEWRKNKSFSIPDAGYHAYFGLSSSALNTETEFDTDLNATKAEIKRAFNKSLKGKKMNKKVLGEFISLIA